VALGGAAEQHKLFTENGTNLQQRPLYTYLGDNKTLQPDGVDLKTEGVLISEKNDSIKDVHLSLAGTLTPVNGVSVTRDNLLRWTRGIDVKDEDDDGIRDEMRRHIGDPMHSRPVILNYSNGTDAPLTTVFMGTNEGIFHGINTVEGREIFSFMPKSLLPNIRTNFENSTASRHQYGLDGPITTWSIDKNNNVMIDPDETAMLYLGMRRGGSNYYAFDVSDRLNPRLDWVIEGGAGGTPGFEKLGQSWSRMVPTKIRFNGVNRNVVVFAGGYDLSNDMDYTEGMQLKLPDETGNTIYIADASTGELIYTLYKTGQESGVGSGQAFNRMDYAIPSDIRVLDIDGNGFADSMFVGDLGGQVWRFDFNLYHEAGDGDLLNGGVLADLSRPKTVLSTTRRFFYEPDVALIRENGERFLSISIGSGWRSHPLNTDVQDQFYMIKSYDIFNMPENYGKKDDAGNWVPILESDLPDISQNTDGSYSPFGWRFKFNRAGEKVIGDAITVNGNVVFTSYLPEADVIACTAAIGAGAVYAIRVADGRPTLDLNKDGRLGNGDHSKMLNHGGVPPEATALIVEGDNGVIKPTILVGPEQPLEGLFSDNLTKRSFWIDTGMTKGGARAAINYRGTSLNVLSLIGVSGRY